MDGYDVVLGKTATGTAAQAGYSLDMGIDGNVADFDLANGNMYSSSTTTAYYQVDLGGSFDIRKIILWNYAAQSARIAGYKIQLINSAGTVLREYQLPDRKVINIDALCPTAQYVRPVGSSKCFAPSAQQLSGPFESAILCGTMGGGAHTGTLASVTSDAEADYAITMQCGVADTSTLGPQNILLGGKKTVINATTSTGWSWLDGSSTSWLSSSAVFWAAGEPNNQGGIVSPNVTTPFEPWMAVSTSGKLTDVKWNPAYACCAAPIITQKCSIGYDTDHPAKSCSNVYGACGNTNRVAWIQPDGVATPYQVYCEGQVGPLRSNIRKMQARL